MSALVLNTSASLGETLLEKTKKCDRYVNILQDKMQERCCITNPHFLLPTFTTKSALSTVAYSHEMDCCKPFVAGNLPPCLLACSEQS
jgi:hypothetical protein